MKPTDEQIEDAAIEYAENTIAVGDKDFLLQVGFEKGANWAISQMQPEWVSVLTPPEESGRYWCYCEEQNDLGTSNFQWNCAYIKDENIWSDKCKPMKVTHWTPLLEPPTK